MGYNARLNPMSANAQMPSVATNASHIAPIFTAAFAGQVVGSGTIMNSGVAAVTSGTTAGSAVSIRVYKTASATASRLGSFGGSGTTIATQATQTFALGTSSTLRQFDAGDVYVAEYVGGAANNASNDGLCVQVQYIYGHDDGTL